MEATAYIFTLITCLLHGYFFILEMFFWTKPLGLKIFQMNEQKANFSRVLAANQGVYNGMLAVGLLLSLIISDPTSAMVIRRYCLCFVIIVGSYGAYSLKNFKVLIIQALPALIALVASEMTS